MTYDLGMKRFLKSIYVIPSLWLAWALYFTANLSGKGVVVLTDPNTGHKIIKKWNGTQYVVQEDTFGDAFLFTLTLVTFIWIALGAIKLVIRFFVRTIHEEKQRVKEEDK